MWEEKREDDRWLYAFHRVVAYLFRILKWRSHNNNGSRLARMKRLSERHQVLCPRVAPFFINNLSASRGVALVNKSFFRMESDSSYTWRYPRIRVVDDSTVEDYYPSTAMIAAFFFDLRVLGCRVRLAADDIGTVKPLVPVPLIISASYHPDLKSELRWSTLQSLCATHYNQQLTRLLRVDH